MGSTGLVMFHPSVEQPTLPGKKANQLPGRKITLSEDREEYAHLHGLGIFECVPVACFVGVLGSSDGG